MQKERVMGIEKSQYSKFKVKDFFRTDERHDFSDSRSVMSF